MPAQTAVKLLLFDLGGVVIQLDFERMYAIWAENSKLSAQQIRVRFEMDGAYERHETGEISGPAYFEHLRETLALSGDDTAITRGWNAMFVGEIAETVEMIERVSHHLPCYGFTNSNPTHETFWRQNYHHALRPLSEVYVSSTLGQRKPQAAAFEMIASATDTPLGAMLFFDDTLVNVEGARAAGLAAVHVAGPADVRRALLDIGALSD